MTRASVSLSTLRSASEACGATHPAKGVKRGVAALALWCALGATLTAQAQPAAQSASPAPAAAPSKRAGSPQDEAGEPRANTSGAAPAAAEPSPDTGQSASKPGASASAGNAAARSASATAGKNAPTSKGPVKNDRLDLNMATVTGDQEQPKVLYIVPWKRSDIGDLQGKPMNSLVDEILSPVDRDVFKRQVVYYEALQGDASQNGAQRPPPAQGEK